MDEYIEREALLADIDAAMENEGMGYVVGQTLKRYVKRAPAADVAPVKHARWEVNELGYLVCTHCGWVRYGIPLVEHYPYCPSCGFRMDG